MMKLLLDQGGNEIKITDGVVMAAVKNYQIGDRMIAFLLSRKGREFVIPDDAFAAIGNKMGLINLIHRYQRD